VLVLDQGDPNHSLTLHRDLEDARPRIQAF